MGAVSIWLLTRAIPLTPDSYIFFSYSKQMAGMAALTMAEVFCGALLIDLYAKTQTEK